MSAPTIFLVGEVSSGKSSFLNSLVGGYVANASLQRETLRPNWYQLASDADSAHLYKLFKQQDDTSVQKISGNLDSFHKQNEADRARISHMTDVEMYELNCICTDKNKLPLRFGIGAFNVIDFPGINDAEDKEGRFLKVIEHHIAKADLLVYVTDANSAFRNESEVQSFNKLSAIVQKEVDDGHYVDIMVVANKFDDYGCPDLTEIYQRIPKHTGLPLEKILRFSSHKMLITNIVKNNRTLYVPEFARRELRRILKTANVIVTSKLKSRLESSGKVSSEDIEYEEELNTYDDSSSSSGSGSSSSHGTEGGYDGDWDRFIGYLGSFNAHLPERTKETMIKRFSKWQDRCVEVYTAAFASGAENPHLTYTCYSQGDYVFDVFSSACASTYMPLFQELNKLLTKCKESKLSPKIFEAAIISMIHAVFKAADKPCIFALLQMVIQMLISNKYASYLNDVLGVVNENLDKLHTGTKRYIISHLLNTKCRYTFPTKLLLSTLQDNYSYYVVNGYEIIRSMYYNITTNKAEKNYSKYEPAELAYGTDPSWYIHNLIYQLPSEWRMLIKLATTLPAYLRSYDRMNVIDYSVCDRLIAPDFRNKLSHYINTVQSSTATLPNTNLNEKFFNIDHEVKDYIVAYNEYIATIPGEYKPSGLLEFSAEFNRFAYGGGHKV